MNLKMLRLSWSCLALMGWAGPAFAQNNNPVVTATGIVTRLQSDWSANALLVQLGPNVPFVNPAGCAFTDAYETNPTDSAAALNHSMLLSAYMNHTPIALTIQGCSFSQRPHIIGVYLSP